MDCFEGVWQQGLVTHIVPEFLSLSMGGASEKLWLSGSSSLVRKNILSYPEVFADFSKALTLVRCKQRFGIKFSRQDQESYLECYLRAG